MANLLILWQHFLKVLTRIGIFLRVLIPVGIFLAVLILWLIAWKWIDININASSTYATLTLDSLLSVLSATPASESGDAAARGQFGDKFGAINALFSGFAFAGIIFTIYLQRLDLQKTREAMSHERFDNTFFQLLQVHIAIAEKINARGAEGREAFNSFNEYLKTCDPDFHAYCALQKLSRDQIRTIKDSATVTKELYPELDDADIANLTESLHLGVGAFDNFLDASLKMHEDKIVKAYVKACQTYIDSFSHYFRNLYHILKFIDESKLISIQEKQSYSRFVRSQLSQYELVTLFYNSIAKIELPGREDMELGFPKMGRLLKRFDMLQNMNPRNLINPIHADIFNKNNNGGI